MSIDAVHAVLQSSSEDAVNTLMDDEFSVFWVDWKQEDETISESCDIVLNTGGKLVSKIVETDSSTESEIHVGYKDRWKKVPLTYSLADRHRTLCTINEVLLPNYEIRFCIASNGSDTLAFLPLPLEQWQMLEQQYGKDCVEKHFYQFSASPNLFTDSLPFK